jgi:hypothetical protein
MPAGSEATVLRERRRCWTRTPTTGPLMSAPQRRFGPGDLNGVAVEIDKHPRAEWPAELRGHTMPVSRRVVSSPKPHIRPPSHRGNSGIALNNLSAGKVST